MSVTFHTLGSKFFTALSVCVCVCLWVSVEDCGECVGSGNKLLVELVFV